MKANKILAKIDNNRNASLSAAEERFKKIIPLLKGMSWYVIGENTIICPLAECKKEILDILKNEYGGHSYGSYDDGRGDIRVNATYVSINYNSHGTQQLTFFENVWGINLLDDWIE